MHITDTAGRTWDVIVAVDTIKRVRDLLNVNLLGYTPAANETFTIVTGTSAAVVGGVGVADPLHWLVQISGTNANNIELVYIPEPATMSLLVLGGMAMLRRRRR